MSEEKQVAKPTPTDLTEADMERVNKFIADGLPDIAKVDESTLYRMTDMYLSGCTYQQIQSTLRLSRPLVLYVSHTYGWYPAKREYLSDIQEKIKSRVVDSKLVSQDFLLLLTQAYQKKITKKLKQYLATDDDSHTDEIDLKEIAQLLKTIEMVKELNNEGKNSKGNGPSVGVNVGEGVTIERSGENKLTITPKEKEKVLGDMLARYADRQRAEEEGRNSHKSDIKKDVNKNEE